LKSVQIGKTTLYEPDYKAEVLITIEPEEGVIIADRVSFLRLEAFVTSVREQIIIVATDKKPCTFCEPGKGWYPSHQYCGVCGKAFNR
jgi:hypothetical protein